MRVLWIANFPLPEACTLAGFSSNPFSGWLVGAARAIRERQGIDLSIAFPTTRVRRTRKVQGRGVDYYFLPSSRRRGVMRRLLANVVAAAKPDIVTVFGTEYPHSLDMLEVCQELDLPCTLWIQGLVARIAEHYFAGLPASVRYGFSLRDIVRWDNCSGQRSGFARKGVLEAATIKMAKYVIGRTTWDLANVLQTNPRVQYFVCNETLRPSFYERIWSQEQCEPRSIFLSQGSYPTKGAHFALLAMPLILSRLPDARLYIAGSSPVGTSPGQRLLRTRYADYLQGLVKKHHLDKHVFFTGPLSEQEMCSRHVRANVFILSSQIENSPNSLGEAMLLGVPCVAAYVGGVPDLLAHGVEGFLYQADAPYMLAHYVSRIFDDPTLAASLGSAARSRALQTHDAKSNARRLAEIYETILVESVQTSEELKPDRVGPDANS